MKKLTLSTALLAALAITGTAQAYQFEANGNAGYAHIKDDTFKDNNEGAFINGSATYYLKDVNSSTGPLAEAAFLSKASSVSAGYEYAQTDGNSDIKLHGFAVGGEFFLPTTTPLYAAATVYRPKFEGVPSSAYFYSADVGVMPVENWLVTLGVVGSQNSGNDDTDPTIGTKYVGKLGANDVNVQGAATFGDDVDSYNLSGDFYIDNTFSVGAGATLHEVDGAKNPYSFNVNARKFIASNISVQGALSAGKGTLDLPSTAAGMIAAGGSNRDNTIGVSVGATYRF